MLLRNPPKPIVGAISVFVVLCIILTSSGHTSTFLGNDVEESRLRNDIYNSTFGVSLRALERTLRWF